jgi:hypothetical protein
VAFGANAEVIGVGIRPSLLEPEKEASVLSKALEVWVAILAIILENL